MEPGAATRLRGELRQVAESPAFAVSALTGINLSSLRGFRYI